MTIEEKWAELMRIALAPYEGWAWACDPTASTRAAARELAMAVVDAMTPIHVDCRLPPGPPDCEFCALRRRIEKLGQDAP